MDPAADPLRSTCQWLAIHARLRPDAVAFAGGHTYQALALNVLRVMDALAALGVSGGQVVGVETADRYLHLLILLAAERLSVTTISLVPSQLEPPADLGRLCDRIMVSAPIASSDRDKFFVMTRDWIASVLGQPMDNRRLDALEPPPRPDMIVRLITSSGTTGVPKVMAMTHRVQQLMIQKISFHIPTDIKRHLDYLCLYQFAVRTSHARAYLTLQLGGTIHLTSGDAIWGLILTGTGNYVSFVSGDLAPFVRTAPAGRGPFNLQIEAVGSAVSARARRQIRETITRNLLIAYGSNEVHHISFVDDDNVGTLLPDVQVKIVDDRGEPVAPGERGLICVRTSTMVDGYIGAPELTRAAFIDGWHHTSDAGFQPAERKLVVLGRADDMLNLGGVKIAAGPIEDRLREIVGISDALVTTIDDNLETSVLLVAVETGLYGDPSAVTRLVTPILGAYVPTFELMAVPVLPRTETGKIRRDAVQALYRRRGD